MYRVLKLVAWRLTRSRLFLKTNVSKSRTTRIVLSWFFNSRIAFLDSFVWKGIDSKVSLSAACFKIAFSIISMSFEVLLNNDLWPYRISAICVNTRWFELLLKASITAVDGVECLLLLAHLLFLFGKVASWKKTSELLANFWIELTPASVSTGNVIFRSGFLKA